MQRPRPLRAPPRKTCALDLLDYGVKHPIHAEIIIDGAFLTEFEGYALSYPNSYELMTVVAILMEFDEDGNRHYHCIPLDEADGDPSRASLAKYLWAAARSEATAEALCFEYCELRDAMRIEAEVRRYAA